MALAFLLIGFISHAQIHYTVANLHSHNDYEKSKPFTGAYDKGFGSIEADIFLFGGQLIIAHDTIQRAWGRTLDTFYLAPLQARIEKNNGYPYADKTHSLQLLIDIKTDSLTTLAKLVETLKSYPAIISCKQVKVVITGRRPPGGAFSKYPSWIWFDAEPAKSYTKKDLKKVVMFSDNFKTYVPRWNGFDALPAGDRSKLVSIVNKAHQLGKTVRFWNAPDLPESWKTYMSLGVDFINTDHIDEAAAFMSR